MNNRHAPPKMTRKYNETMAFAAAIHNAPLTPIEQLEAEFNAKIDALLAEKAAKR